MELTTLQIALIVFPVVLAGALLLGSYFGRKRNRRNDNNGNEDNT